MFQLSAGQELYCVCKLVVNIIIYFFKKFFFSLSIASFNIRSMYNVLGIRG